MKKLLIYASALALALGLSACTSANGTANNSPTPEVEAVALSTTWESQSNLGASDVLGALESLGYCGQIPTENDGTYSNDTLVEYQKNTFRLCYSWQSSEDPSTLKCPSTFYVSTGDSSNLYEPRRSLSYEDGMSVALFYGTNYQVEVSPANQGSLSSEELVADCEPLISELQDLIGGERNNYGDYDPDYSSTDGTATEDESSYTESELAQPAAPQIEMVSTPNLVGALDGKAKNWLFQNGYRNFLNIKSTGFNPKLSCLMSGQNVIIKQSPAPGTQIQNVGTAQITVYVNCEW